MDAVDRWFEDRKEVHNVKHTKTKRPNTYLPDKRDRTPGYDKKGYEAVNPSACEKTENLLASPTTKTQLQYKNVHQPMISDCERYHRKKLQIDELELQ